MIRFAGKTDRGRRLSVNEDAIGWDTDRHLWFVADGLGGHAQGQMASGLVKETLLTGSTSDSVEQAVLRAHAAIQDRAHQEGDYAGMASTVVCADVRGTVCRIVWVGDSRAYLYRAGTLRRLTRDHSLIEQLRQLQDLTPEQIRANPDRHRVTQALGLESPVPSVAIVPLRPGDRILLCSDGLTDDLEDAAILGILSENPLLEQAVDALITGALEHGGQDNVSVIVISYDGRVLWRLRDPATRMTLMWILLGSAALIVGIAVWNFLHKH